MTEFEALKRISAYIAENKQQSSLEAEVKNMVVKANKEFHQKTPGKDFDPEPLDKVQDEDQGQRLDTIYDEEPLGFEKDPLATNIMMLAQDPLEEIDLEEGLTKKPTYISANISHQLNVEVIQLLKEFKDCFTWDYDEMSGLSKDLVELKLPIKPGKKPIKQNPR